MPTTIVETVSQTVRVNDVTSVHSTDIVDDPTTGEKVRHLRIFGADGPDKPVLVIEMTAIDAPPLRLTIPDGTTF